MRSGMAGLLATVLAAVMAGGCLETETPLAPPQQGAVEAKLVGNWELKEGDKSTDIIVRNFDGHQLYVELHDPDKSPERYAVQVTPLKGGSFAQIRALTDDGTLEQKYVIMRADLAGDDKVNLRHLNGEFFDDKPHDTPQKLRALLEANIDNPAMYEGDPFPLTRKAG
jgi:hypothetical protein